MVSFYPVCILLYIVSVQGSCPDGWAGYQTSCYHLFQEKENWLQAREVCLHHNGHLVTIESKDENSFLKNLIEKEQIQNDNVWIGGSDMLNEGDFVWTGTDKGIGFSDWFPGQPDNGRGDEDCLEYSVDGGYQWDDRSCDARSQFLCEVRY